MEGVGDSGGAQGCRDGSWGLTCLDITPSGSASVLAQQERVPTAGWGLSG